LRGGEKESVLRSEGKDANWHSLRMKKGQTTRALSHTRAPKFVRATLNTNDPRRPSNCEKNWLLAFYRQALMDWKLKKLSTNFRKKE
jgi:hypothetical protein